MLPKSAWRLYEPRFGFPTFKGLRTYASESILPTFTPLIYPKVLATAKSAVKSGARSTWAFVREYAPLLLFCRSNLIRFRVIITTRQGKYLGTYRVPGKYPPGGSIDLDVTEVIAGMGLPDDDYMAILIASNGWHMANRPSPGTYSMTYVGDRFYTTYRTGGFIRFLNDPKKKSHYGFRGINPKAVADNRFLSSILLINHSSNPLYDTTVTPHSVLLRADGATREATFGPIGPFGGLERSLEDLFGKDVAGFLAPTSGRGTVITTCPGVTLGSIHLMRARDGSSMAIEHSRPTHMYLLSKK